MRMCSPGRAYAGSSFRSENLSGYGEVPSDAGKSWFMKLSFPHEKRSRISWRYPANPAEHVAPFYCAGVLEAAESRLTKARHEREGDL